MRRYLQILLITSYISHDFRQAVDIILLHQKEEAFERILGILKKEPLAQFSFVKSLQM
jgi:hypothetical protein